MKEVLTKQFWRDVKKTFDEARIEPTAKGDAASLPAAEAEETPAREGAPQSNGSSDKNEG